MTSSRFAPLAFGVGTGLLLTGSAWPVAAQTIGSFQWQLQPYCNVVVVTVSQQAATYTVDGYDDQCAAPQRAPLVGVATPNPDGTIGFGLHVVTVPGGHALDIDARISLPALSGSWTDTAGNSGTFAFGAAAGGSPRPMPPASLPSTVTVLANGAFSSKYNGTGGVITASGGGTRMLWQPVKAAFRAGTVYGDTWDYAMVGYASAAFGISTRAVATGSFAIGNLTSAEGLFSLAAGNLTRSTGEYSAALGWATNATGQASLAVGTGTLASGSGGFAGGQQTTASGPQSVALGLGSTATGEHAFAMGDSSQANAGNAVAFGASARANGYESIAMGQNVTTLGNGGVALGSNATAAAGSWAFGDRSTTNVLSTAVMNQFAARAAGGVTFFTNAAMTAGVALASGGSGWGVVSDRRMKENFRDLHGDEVLAKISQLPVREWNYTTQDAAIRHVGPTAQDFHEAFGLGESDLRINTIDADGIALAGVQALERRTRAADESFAGDVARLRHEVAQLRALVEALQTATPRPRLRP